MSRKTGPVWRGGSNGEPELLERCYRNCIEIAEQHQLRTVAFPSISTGIFGYPITLAARTAIAVTRDAISTQSSIVEVTFCCFSDGG